MVLCLVARMSHGSPARGGLLISALTLDWKGWPTPKFAWLEAVHELVGGANRTPHRGAGHEALGRARPCAGDSGTRDRA